MTEKNSTWIKKYIKKQLQFQGRDPVGSLFTGHRLPTKSKLL